MEFKDIPQELIEAATANLAVVICQRLGVPRSRLKTIQTFDPAMSGRTGLRVIFDPVLSTEESARFREVLSQLSDETNGSPPIFAQKV